MLERQRLLIGPWIEIPEPTRAVLDPASGARLGIVRRRSGRWLRCETLEVYETEDESLLCCIRLMPWWWPGSVGQAYDAEERRVAIVRGAAVHDGQGRLVAHVTEEDDGRSGAFVAGDGTSLAEWTQNGEEVSLQFSEALTSQPFAKMALLGEILCRK
jgi:hypothetical protein